MVNSVSIVEIADDMQLIPDNINRLDLINFVLDSQIPDNFDSPSEKFDFVALGKWLFENREDILNDKLPTAPSGNIYDTGYPLDKFKVNTNEQDGSNQ